MLRPLGLVTVAAAGTPVVSTSLTGAQASFQSILVQPHWSNTGKIIVGRKGMDVTTGEGVLGWAGAPTDPTGATGFSMSVPNVAIADYASEIYIDAEVSGEKAFVSLGQQ